MMRVKFSKMHGIGNDFMVVDLISQHAHLRPEQIKRLSDRHFGIGFDQLLLIEPPRKPEVDFSYRIFNADGQEVEQCGNGARCFARYVVDRGLSDRALVSVETCNGLIQLQVNDDASVTVDMGAPRLAPAEVPFQAEQQQLTYWLDAAGGSHELSVLSMGNPHGVLLVDDSDTAPVDTLGPALMRHPDFPEQANIGFMQVIDRQTIKLRVFERGVGETLACGTGACAAVVAGQMRGLLDPQVTVQLPGGSLHISWEGEGSSVLMRGPAEYVYEGEVRL